MIYFVIIILSLLYFIMLCSIKLCSMYDEENNNIEDYFKED